MSDPSDLSDPIWESVALEASRRKVLELTENLAKAHRKIAGLEDRWASARSVLSDTSDRLREEITNAEQAEERVAQTAAYSADVIEANKELMQRVLVLEGFLVLCEGCFIEYGLTSWAGEAGRVLRGEEKA